MAVFHLNELGHDSISKTVNGRELLFSPLTLGERSKVQAVLRRVLPDPIDVAKNAAQDQPVPVANAIWEKALKARAFWPPSIDSQEGLALIDSNLEIQVAIVKGSLKPNHPDMGDDEIRKIAESFGTQEFAQVAVFALTGKRVEDPNWPTPNQPSQPTGIS